MLFYHSQSNLLGSLPYETKALDLGKNEQKEQWFLDINPNGRIPAMTDTFDDGNTIRLFESGSIMLYLAATYDRDFKISYPPGTREYYEMVNWLFYLNAGVGPMQGQANHFTRYAPEHIEYGITRYQNETRRLYGVLEKHLEDSKSDYLVGDKCTIADLAHWGWIAAAGWAGIDITQYPKLQAWEERLEKRPGVAKGMNVPTEYKLKAILKDPAKTQEYAEKSKSWVQSGMKADAEKYGQK